MLFLLTRTLRHVAPVVALALASCSTPDGAAAALPGRRDVVLTPHHLDIQSGLSGLLSFDISPSTASLLIEVQGHVGQYHLAQFITPTGDDLVESGGFVTRDAREVPGLVDWLYPNSPEIQVQGGRYALRLAAVDTGGNAVDESVSVLLYERQRTPVTTGQIAVDVLVANGALDPAKESDSVVKLLGRMTALYAQIGIDVAYAAPLSVDLPSADITLDGTGEPSSIRPAVAAALRNARPYALHLILVHSLEGGAASSTLGYSLGLPGPINADLPTAGVLVATGPFGGPAATDLDSMAVSCAHEIGHFLGLYHTSEADHVLHDPIVDTPECVSDPCPDADNIMFWTGGGTRSRFTPGQATVIRRHPLFIPAAVLPPGQASCMPTCAPPQTCAVWQGAGRCMNACDPAQSTCTSGSCVPADDGTLVCSPGAT